VHKASKRHIIRPSKALGEEDTDQIEASYIPNYIMNRNRATYLCVEL